MRLFQIIGATICILLIALLCLVAWDLHRAAAHFNQVITDADRSIMILGGAATNLEKTLAAERAASQAQLEAAAEGQKKLNANLDALSVTIRNANIVLANLNNAIGDQNGNLATLEAQSGAAIDELRHSIAELAPAARAATQTLQNTATITGDPSISSTLHEIEKTSGEVELTSEHLEASMKDIQAFIHRETTPIRGTWNVVKRFLMEFAGPAAQVATAAK